MSTILYSLTEILFEPDQKHYFLLAAQLRDADYLKFFYISWKYTIHLPLHTNLHCTLFLLSLAWTFFGRKSDVIKNILIKHAPLYCGSFSCPLLQFLQVSLSFFLHLRLLHSLLKFSSMLDGVSQVVLEAYSRFYYSYPYSQQQPDEQELSILSKGSEVHRLWKFCHNPSLILSVKSLRCHQVIEQLKFTIHVNWHCCMGSHFALC